MNYLITIYLSQYFQNNDKIVGNFIGDFVKPSNYSKYTYNVVDGMLHNSRVQSYMKSHPSFERSKGRLNPRYSKYSAEIVQLFYGHFLAANWNKNSQTDIESAVNNNYYIILESFDLVPYKLRRMLPVLISPKGISNIGTIGGLNSFIAELGKKGYIISNLQYTLQDLMAEYSGFQQDFEQFFADLNKFAFNTFSHKEEENTSEFVLAHAS
ncbi:MAG: ACP phosphodiesterase [Cytophagaceae bacterium]|nr:ACP phosphodiesterase [Cytophagaceae bacterium]